VSSLRFIGAAVSTSRKRPRHGSERELAAKFAKRALLQGERCPVYINAPPKSKLPKARIQSDINGAGLQALTNF